MSLVAGSVTRLTGRREYVRVGLTAAFPAADTCQSSNRTLLSTIRSILNKASYLELYPLVSSGFEFKWVSINNANIA